MNKMFYILKKCSGCGHTFTSSYRKSNPCGKCGGKVEIVQDIQALLEAHKEIVGKVPEQVRYFTTPFMIGQGYGARVCRDGEVDILSDIYFEVTKQDLLYLKKPDVVKYGETMFRKIETDDWYIQDFDVNGDAGHGSIIKAGYAAEHYEDYALKGFAWCLTSKNHLTSGGPINVHTQCQVKWFIPRKGSFLSAESVQEHLRGLVKHFEELRVSIPSDEFTIEDFTIYVWPDYTWISKEDSTEEYFQGKSDDYMILDVPDYVKDVDLWLRVVKPQG